MGTTGTVATLHFTNKLKESNLCQLPGDIRILQWGAWEWMERSGFATESVKLTCKKFQVFPCDLEWKSHQQTFHIITEGAPGIESYVFVEVGESVPVDVSVWFGLVKEDSNIPSMYSLHNITLRLTLRVFRTEQSSKDTKDTLWSKLAPMFIFPIELGSSLKKDDV